MVNDLSDGFDPTHLGFPNARISQPGLFLHPRFLLSITLSGNLTPLELIAFRNVLCATADLGRIGSYM